MVANLFVLAIAGFALAVEGCAATNPRGPKPDQAQTAMGCQKCYDFALTYQRNLDRRWPWPRSKTAATHMCEKCSSHIELYTLDGKPMIRCPQCAPAGQACDKCRLPNPLTQGEQNTSGK